MNVTNLTNNSASQLTSGCCVTLQMTFHVDEDLESRAGEELGIEPVASHQMTDPTSEDIADSPHPRSPGHTKMADTVDIF